MLSILLIINDTGTIYLNTIIHLLILFIPLSMALILILERSSNKLKLWAYILVNLLLAFVMFIYYKYNIVNIKVSISLKYYIILAILITSILYIPMIHKKDDVEVYIISLFSIAVKIIFYISLIYIAIISIVYSLGNILGKQVYDDFQRDMFYVLFGTVAVWFFLNIPKNKKISFNLTILEFIILYSIIHCILAYV